MNEYITNALIENTYLFCVRRISDSEAARDLSQDILHEALRVIASGKEFVSFYSWYWRMAKNKYADHITHKQNSALPIEAAIGHSAEDMQPIESLIASEYGLTMNYVLPDENYDYSILDKLREIEWSCLEQGFNTAKHGKVIYQNNFDMTPFPVDSADDLGDWRKGRDRWVNSENISLLIELTHDPDKALSSYEEEKAAELLKNGLLKKENNKLIVQLPVMKIDVHSKIWCLLRDELKTLAEEYVDLISKGVEELLLPYVRKDLMSIFIHWDIKHFFDPKEALFYYGWDKHLALPEDYSTSAAGLYIIKE